MGGSTKQYRCLLLTCLVATLTVSGCALPEWARNGFKVGPNYAKPPSPVAEEWIDYKNAKLDSKQPAPTEWWRSFNDPILDELIESAYRQNITLRVAGARILQARAERGIAVGNLFPQLQEAFGSFTRNKLSAVAAHAPQKLYFNNRELGFNLGWELDFWGRFRRAIEAADAVLDASIENYDDVLRILLADVAANYIQYRTYQARLVYVRQNVKIQEGSYEIATERFKNGATTKRDKEMARQVLEQTRALVPPLETGLRQANNALCILLGFPPRDLSGLLQEGTIPETPPEIAVGIPADLVRRRPDVRQAERLAAAQSARIGIAKSDFYPRIVLAGSIAVNAEKFSKLFDTPASLAGFIGPGFNWEILNYGRILNNVRAQDAHFQELAFAYQQAVLQAGREAEDSIVAFLNNHLQLQHVEASVDAAIKALDIATLQYKEGDVDYTTVFLFEDRLAGQQDLLAQTLGSISLSMVDIYRALGGGWEMRFAREGDGHAGHIRHQRRAVLRMGQPPVDQIVVQPHARDLPAVEQPIVERPAVLGAPVAGKDNLP